MITKLVDFLSFLLKQLVRLIDYISEFKRKKERQEDMTETSKKDNEVKDLIKNEEIDKINKELWK